MTIPADKVAAALKHLRSSDPVMKQTIKQVGPFTLKLEKDRFRVLARSIVSQQISTKAAQSIRKRLEAMLPSGKLTAEDIMITSFEKLRSAGLSGQKATYMQDLAQKVLDEEVQLRTIGRKSDEEVIAELIQVKGIGRWTAQMFLIFSLGRLDVLPHDDLGIRTAIKNLYQLDELPNKKTCFQIAESWTPYSSVASWYCWRSGDL